MSVPLGALVSKSRRMTWSSWSSDSIVEKSSCGMMLEGSTRRPCRFRTKAFTGVLSDGPVVAADLGPACAPHSSLDGRDEPWAQLGGGDDVVHRAHLAGPADVVDGLELRGHLAQLLRPHAAAKGRELDPQVGLLHAGGGAECGLELAHPGISGGALVDLAGEHDGGGGCAAQDRRVRALDGEDLHVLVQYTGEHHEGAAVVPG